MTIVPDPRIMTVPEVCAELRLSEATMRRRAADDPHFPRKIKLSIRRVGYFRRDVEAYLARQREAATA